MFRYIKRSFLSYWYLGYKKVAVTGGIIGLVVNSLFLYFISAHESAFILVLLLLTDYFMTVLVVIYIFFIRNIISFDEFFIKYFIILLFGLLINRIIVNLVAEKIYKYKI